MDTILSEKHRVVRRSVRRFCERELQPIAKEIDQEARFPWEVVEKMGRLGYFGIQVPKELGGSNLDSLSYAIIIEEISRVCAGLGLCVTVHNSVAVYPILAFGSEEQKTEWVPPLARGEKIGAFCLTEPNAGSDATGIESTAIKDGENYVVNANKVFVTNGGVADICLIFVQTNPGADRKEMSVVVAERGTPGFVVGDLEALDTGRMGIAAQSAGIGQAALEESLQYARQRRQFGVPIERHQAIQSMIADMATLVDAAKLMTYRAAVLRDKGKPFSQESAMAKLFASEASSKITDMAVQIHGGYGYSKSYPVERYYRDARVTRIYEGTSEIHRMVIARGLMR